MARRKLDTHAMRVELDYKGNLSMRINMPSRWLAVAGIVMSSMWPANPEAEQGPRDQAQQRPRNEVEAPSKPQELTKDARAENEPRDERRIPGNRPPRHQTPSTSGKALEKLEPVRTEPAIQPRRTTTGPTPGMCREAEFEHLECSQCAGPCILTCSQRRCGNDFRAKAY